MRQRPRRPHILRTRLLSQRHELSLKFLVFLLFFNLLKVRVESWCFGCAVDIHWIKRFYLGAFSDYCFVFNIIFEFPSCFFSWGFSSKFLPAAPREMSHFLEVRNRPFIRTLPRSSLSRKLSFSLSPWPKTSLRPIIPMAQRGKLQLLRLF